jgi:two-component system, OmpR family, response regulator
MSRTILVADEDLDTRIILRVLLERNGYVVVEASSAVEATQACANELALVILNHPMNVDADLSLARWVRSQPATRDLPIINLTSRAIPMLIEEASQQGVTITLAKPLDVKRILLLVRELTSPQLAH